jgi:hypothetical protein
MCRVYGLTPEERVEKGVAFLAGRVPNWRSYIDPFSLHIKYGEHCIVGQLALKGAFGERPPQADPFSWGLAMLGIDGGQADYGFAFYGWGDQVEVERMNAAWKAAIVEPEVEWVPQLWSPKNLELVEV